MASLENEELHLSVRVAVDTRQIDTQLASSLFPLADGGPSGLERRGCERGLRQAPDERRS